MLPQRLQMQNQMHYQRDHMRSCLFIQWYNVFIMVLKSLIIKSILLTFAMSKTVIREHQSIWLWFLWFVLVNLMSQHIFATCHCYYFPTKNGSHQIFQFKVLLTSDLVICPLLKSTNMYSVHIFSHWHLSDWDWCTMWSLWRELNGQICQNLQTQHSCGTEVCREEIRDHSWGACKRYWEKRRGIKRLRQQKHAFAVRGNIYVFEGNVI